MLLCLSSPYFNVGLSWLAHNLFIPAIKSPQAAITGWLCAINGRLFLKVSILYKYSKHKDILRDKLRTGFGQG